MSTPPSCFPAVERCRRYLATLPPAISGQGGHDATFRAACIVWNGFGLDEATTYALLASEFNPRCQPEWSPGELMHKVRSAAAATHGKPRSHLLGEIMETPVISFGPAPKWPEANEEEIARIVCAGPSALELWERSPQLLDVDDGSNCESIIKNLFVSASAPDPLLCVGKSNSEFATRPLSTWLAKGKLYGFPLIVPNPMTTRAGRTKEGKESEHCLENTGPRRFLVVEFDKGTADDHAARLWHLTGFAPLSLVVHSGSRSLHGWFYCAGQQEKDLRRFMNYAVSIGADRATWTRSQFVRLPAGQRENGARQSVFYFDPGTLQPTEGPPHER